MVVLPFCLFPGLPLSLKIGRTTRPGSDRSPSPAQDRNTFRPLEVSSTMRPRPFFALCLALALPAALSAQEPIRFARTPEISPDGKLVAFSYLGDIWVVETIGRIAR